MSGPVKTQPRPRSPPAAPRTAPRKPPEVLATAAKKKHPPPAMPHLSKTQALSTFERLDRNKDRHLDARDLVAPSAVLKARPMTRMRGDSNGDLRLTRSEFVSLATHARQPPKKASAPGTGRHQGSVPSAAAYQMKPGQSATLRTHASGMVLGRVRPFDTFVSSHRHGDWVYGHVKGKPNLRGWALAESLPKRRAATSAERAESTRGPIDLRRRAGLEYTTGKDKQALQFLQQDLTSQGKRVGYTTPVRPRDPSQPIKVYANYPCSPDQQLKTQGGNPLEIKAGKDVKFRYSPDGQHAVVLVMPHGAKEGHGVWGIVPLSKLDMTGNPIGLHPGQPIRHR